MKQKFEIIEEGRLSKSEMGKIAGGTLIASGIDTYDCKPKYEVVDGCMGVGTINLSHCPIYKSCNDTKWTACSPYSGQPGPQGYTVTTQNFANIAYDKLQSVATYDILSSVVKWV